MTQARGWMIVGALLLAAVARAADAPEIQIREYVVPTPEALPHDPAAGPDGALWVTEQKANKLGRLDASTGKFREYPLPTANSGPHGLTVDGLGKVWFTANYKGYIGKLDPRTGKVTEYRWKDSRVTDPHTPVFDGQGILWFTAQESNVIGRLDPATGATRFVTVPTPKASPYGIVIGADGSPYFCEFGADKIGRVDPRTLNIQEYALPAGARPRRLALAGDGTLYYSDYARGFLGHLYPRSGKVEEWRSPAGPGARPYGIAITGDGRVWFSESGVEPNTLVAFDPRTKRFATAIIPSGGGVVRNMTVAPDGRLYLACSGTNRVAVVAPLG